MRQLLITFLLASLVLANSVFVFAQEKEVYRIGPDDKLLLRAADLDELNEKRVVVARDGAIDLPLAGRIQAGGLSVTQLGDRINELLKRYYYEPRVSVEVEEYASQPVSVLGSVGKSGIYQLQGTKSLAEVLAMAGGLQPEAGYSVLVERHGGPAPEIISYNLRDIMRGGTKADTAMVQAHDVITVPRALLVYVIGDVRKPGGFALGEKQNVSVLQALALAEGASTTAALSHSTILRVDPVNQQERKSINIDLKRLIQGKSADLGLQADDILVIPSSNSRKVAIRAAEIAAQTLSGVVVWRGL